jgi:hypothetical protein
MLTAAPDDKPNELLKEINGEEYEYVVWAST